MRISTAYCGELASLEAAARLDPWATVLLAAVSDQSIRHVTPLNSVQLRILEILGFDSEVYARLEAVSVEPP